MTRIRHAQNNLVVLFPFRFCRCSLAEFGRQLGRLERVDRRPFASAKSAFSIALNLTGLLCLWLGLLKIAERSGITEALARLLRPLFARIMPGVPADSPAVGSMVMNIAANVLGLDNAATPAGLKAMEQLQADNPHKDTASDAQIMFMVINSSAVTLIPITILMYRSELGSENPAAVFVPILLSTSASTLVGFCPWRWCRNSMFSTGWCLAGCFLPPLRSAPRPGDFSGCRPESGL